MYTTVAFDTCGSDADPGLIVMGDTDCDGNLECLGTNDDGSSCGGGADRFEVNPTTLCTYYVFVKIFASGDNDAEGGEGDFGITAECS